MKKHLELINTKGMNRQDWLGFRQQGIGASEVGTVLGLDDYMSSLELFYYKIGDRAKFDITHLSAFLGREEEPLLARMWRHWDGDQDRMIDNYLNGRVIRRCQRVNGFLRNSKYPWLFVSLDRKILRHDGKGEGALELKTITGWEADKWTGGIPPKHVTQVQTQLGVGEFDYGELALCEDRRRFDVLPFEINKNIWEHIVDATHTFWQRVEKARKLVNEKYVAMTQFNQGRVDELNYQIDNLAPEPDGTLAYASFLAEKHDKPNKLERDGTQEELMIARLQGMYYADVKTALEKKVLQENRLKAAMGDVQVLNFGSDGKVYWTLNEEGGRTFRNKLITV